MARRSTWARVGAVVVVALVAAGFVRSRGIDQVAVIFDGQSLNRAPERGYPELLMEGRGIRWSIVAVNGRSWVELALDKETRLYPHANDGETTILVMCGGTSNIDAGQSAEEYYAEEVAYAQAARDAGFDLILNTTLPPSSTFTRREEAVRQAANGLKLADPKGAFDAVADLNEDPMVAKKVDFGYIDGTHWTAEGAQAAATVVAPVLDRLLEGIG